MSTCYWVIEGIGIDTDKIVPHLNKDKLIKFLQKQIPEDDGVLRLTSNSKILNFDIEDFLYGNPFDNLADLLTHCDRTDSITYGVDGEGGSYFYYPPSMPWHRVKNEPDTPEEVHRRIIKAVQVITNLSHEEIETMIDDDLYIVGVG